MWKMWHQKTLMSKQLSNGIFTSNKYNITHYVIRTVSGCSDAMLQCTSQYTHFTITCQSTSVSSQSFLLSLSHTQSHTHTHSLFGTNYPPMGCAAFIGLYQVWVKLEKSQVKRKNGTCTAMNISLGTTDKVLTIRTKSTVREGNRSVYGPSIQLISWWNIAVS